MSDYNLGLVCPDCKTMLQMLEGCAGDMSVGDQGNDPDVFCPNCEISFTRDWGSYDGVTINEEEMKIRNLLDTIRKLQKEINQAERKEW